MRIVHLCTSHFSFLTSHSFSPRRLCDSSPMWSFFLRGLRASVVILLSLALAGSFLAAAGSA